MDQPATGEGDDKGDDRAGEDQHHNHRRGGKQQLEDRQGAASFQAIAHAKQQPAEIHADGEG